MPPSSALRNPGISIIASNSRGPTMRTSRSVVASTVALRGPASMAASSPKWSPAWRMLTTRPARVTVAVPSRITKSSRPRRPSRRMTSPAWMWRRSATRAISESCSSVHAANHGTPCRCPGPSSSPPSLSAPNSASPGLGGVHSPPRKGTRWGSRPAGFGRSGRMDEGEVTPVRRRPTPQRGAAAPRGRRPGGRPWCAATGHAAEQGVAEAGDGGHGGEFARADDQHVELGQRGHGGVPRSGVHGRQLTEEVAGAEGVDLPALLGHRHPA